MASVRQASRPRATTSRHLEAAHPLLGHPGQGRRLGPVAPQPELQEPVAPGCARLDQSAHRRPVTDQRPELGVAGVGVGVEMDDGHAAPAHVAGDPGDVGPGDGVISPEDHREGADLGHLLDDRLQAGHGRLDVAGRHLDVTDVDHAELDQRVDPEGQVGPAAVMGQIVGEADGLGTEASPRAIGRPAVVGGADDHGPGARVGGRVGEVGGRHSDEGGAGPYMWLRRRHPRYRRGFRPRSRTAAGPAPAPSAMDRGPRSRMSVPSGAREATVASVPGTNPWAER